jgi:hypothetical protein
MNKPTVTFRSEIRITEPRPTQKGYSCRWDFDVRFSNSDHLVGYGHRVVADTFIAAQSLALQEAVQHSDELNPDELSYLKYY